MTFRLLYCSSIFVFLAACSEQPAAETTAAQASTDASKTTGNRLPRTPSTEGASVFFIMPSDGASVSNPITIEFGIRGMSVVKAGDSQPGSGHHHLLIDTAIPNLDLPVPADQQHVHFGDGSTLTEITLPPGEHSLQMLLADSLHIPHDPPLLSEAIKITVE